MIYRKPDKGDPSDELQLFPQFDLNLLCCRYWGLKNWEFGELSYPYWRIYWNPEPGAKIIYQKEEIELDKDKIVIIAPNTSYATRLFNNKIPENGFILDGGRIHTDNLEENVIKRNEIPHLFIHFSIGIPYDYVNPQVFVIKTNDYWLSKLSSISNSLKLEFRKFDFSTSLILKSLILDLLIAIPDQEWELITKDDRILSLLKFIELNLSEDLSNDVLAKEIGLVTNAFNRLFKSEVGVSPQMYIRKKRIDKACALLDHSHDSIDLIADETGFADRYHFSKIFKQVTGTSPAKYRKEFDV